MTVLVNDMRTDANLLHYAKTLAHRLRQTLKGIIKESELAPSPEENGAVSWIALPDLSLPALTSVLNQTESSLVFMPASIISLLPDLLFNCVIYPAA
jgi:hypothetical protein